MIEDLIKYKFNNKLYTNKILELDDKLVTIGNKVLFSYVNNKLIKEFVYISDNIEFYFDEDVLNKLCDKLLSDDYLSDRIIKLHINEIFLNSERFVDLFKAIIGAYYLDNNKVEDSFYDYLLNIDDTILLSIDQDNNYYKKVYEWNKLKYKETLRYELNINDNDYNVKIYLNSFDKAFEAKSHSKYISLIEAAKLAYKELENNNLLLKMSDIVGFANQEQCVNQLQELFIKGFINEPQYKIAMKGSNNGVDIWKCRILIDGYKESFSAEDTSKKTAKRNAAYQMLNYILEKEN